jgi:hypothetical protein
LAVDTEAAGYFGRSDALLKKPDRFHPALLHFGLIDGSREHGSIMHDMDKKSLSFARDNKGHS